VKKIEFEEKILSGIIQTSKNTERVSQQGRTRHRADYALCSAGKADKRRVKYAA
jgi:hypothetical protein